ncbi:MAG TPA: UDP-N-acetyl-alpha-D-muramoyl-L-alanyl-L-glutamate epimerase [Rudaea sp.]|nr:UDP-N-acetyl-alpha-D-muramoyl-L-alanyl-L-glutamate epimerase [Rudaea sp.]
MTALTDPRQAKVFRFVRCTYANGEAQLVYALDDGPELIERIGFPDAPALPHEREAAFAAALRLLHLIAGTSYYKAGVPKDIVVVGEPLDVATARFLDQVYLHGLAEFAYQNKLDLRGRIRFPHGAVEAASAPALKLSRRTLVPIGGGKDSLVSVEMLKRMGEPATAVWVGDSALIAACAQRTRLPMLNLKRRLAPELFEYNRLGAYNGHIPVTAINSAIALCAAILYDFDAIAFSNERSASEATLEYDGQPVNHQWSKSFEFERALREHVAWHIAMDLDYFSLLRPWSELAVASAFARESRYDDVFSSCNRNFRIRGERPADRWCGQCPKCHFVFLALAPFVAKPRLLNIFGRNLLDDIALAPGFDALLEYHEHKPFECVGEGRESRAAMFSLTQRAEWREDALVARFAEDIAPQLDRAELELATLLHPASTHFLPFRLRGLLHAHG